MMCSQAKDPLKRLNMPILDFDAARQFFASQPALPMMVYLYGSAESVSLAPHVGLRAEEVIAAYSCAMVFGSPTPLFINGAVLTADELRFASNDEPVQTVPLNKIAEFRHGFEVAELVLQNGGRVRLHSQLIPFLKLCMECMRETVGARN
jgi:hypothetical protein